MNPQQRYELISDLSYFWKEKGDITRLAGFDIKKVQEEFPEVLRAWNDYKHAELALSLIIENSYDKASVAYEE